MRSSLCSLAKTPPSQQQATSSSNDAGPSSSCPGSATNRSNRSSSAVRSALSATARTTPPFSGSASGSRPFLSKLDKADKAYPDATVWMARSGSFFVDKWKEYKGFTGLKPFLEFAEAWAGLDTSLYEMVRDPSQPVLAFFDADMTLGGSALHEKLASDLDASTQDVAHAFLGALQDILPGGMILTPGVNCQVSAASRGAIGPGKPPKISLHVVCYIEMDNMAMAKSLTLALHTHIMELPGSDPRRHLLTHAPHGVLTSILDSSVYKKSQLFRLLHSMKAGKPESLLKPILGSSNAIGAHLVSVYGTDAGLAEAEATECLNAPGSPLMPKRTIVTLPGLSEYLTKASASGGASAAAARSSIGVSRVPPSITRRMQHQPPEAITPAWPPGFINLGLDADGRLESALKANTALCNLFKTDELIFSSKTLMSSTVCCFSVHARCNAHCPYAGRQHASNNLYMTFNYAKRSITVKCHDEECKAREQEEPVEFHLSLPSEDPSCTRSSLHDYQHSVSWADDYDSSKMKPYPTAKGTVAAIVAGMGLGKTKEMMNLINGSLRGAESILLLTHRRSLARKYKEGLDAHRLQTAEAELEGDEDGLLTRVLEDIPEFICYLDVQGAINAKRAIVCVNSATRIPLQNFSAIFIDEAAGVLSQLTSKLISDHSPIINHITNLMASASRLYFLDAFADTTIVADFATLVAQLRSSSVPVTWIRNRHIATRPDSARATTIHQLDGGSAEKKAFEAAFLAQVVSSLKAGKKVYVPCSTKAFAEVVASAVKLACPELNCQLYTSSSDQRAKDDALANVATAWEDVDCVVASNSLESGVSYEGNRFSEVVVWAQNCMDHGAPVFSILQQMFRVRNLGPEGRMTIYASESVVGRRPGEAQYPCTSEGVDAMLAVTHRAVLSYMPDPLVAGARYTARVPAAVGSSRGSGSSAAGGAGSSQQDTHLALHFDMAAPSYHLLRGALVMRHKSNVHWSSIIAATLRDEYALPVTTKMFSVCEAGAVDEAASSLRSSARGEAAKLGAIPYSPELLLSPEDYGDLRQQQRAGVAMQAEQLQKLHTTRVFRKVWGIEDDSLFDEAFYNEYVGLYSKASDVEEKRQKFYALRRAAEVIFFM